MHKPDTIKIVYLLAICGFFMFFFSKVYTKTENSSAIPFQVKSEIVEGLSNLLAENYVFPEKGEKMAKALQEGFEEGNFEEVETFEVFAEKLTDFLRAEVNDKHLRIKVKNSTTTSFTSLSNSENRGITACKVIENNIGYLSFNGFPRLDGTTRDAVAKAMESLVDTRAVIIDLRNNGGGDPATVQLYCSYFFGKQPILLNSLYFRPENITRDFYTLKKIKGERMPDKLLYVLTSDYTFSGAEEFCYNMQSRERATIIGEVTGGGAHPVNAFNLHSQLTAHIPIGRAINPITGTNWEGAGVQPHILCDATEALQKALEKIETDLAQAH